jgi:hypothetical protein
MRGSSNPVGSGGQKQHTSIYMQDPFGGLDLRGDETWNDMKNKLGGLDHFAFNSHNVKQQLTGSSGGHQRLLCIMQFFQ